MLVAVAIEERQPLMVDKLLREHVDFAQIFTYAREGDDVNLKRMLDFGADVNMRDFDRGCTPLHYACAAGSKGVIQVPCFLCFL